MASVPRRWLCTPLALLLAAAGCYPYRDMIDPVVCDVAAHPVDLQPLTPADQAPPTKPATDAAVKPASFDEPNPTRRHSGRPPASPRRLPAGRAAAEHPAS